MSTVEYILDFIKREKQKKKESGGMTAKEFGEQLGVRERAALYWVSSRVADGSLKPNGYRSFIRADGRRSYAPVYIQTPHEAS